MDRRQFVLAAGFSALFANKSFAQDWGGDRIAGRKLASRSVVYGANGAAATAHPIASLVGIDILRKGGSAIDAAIAINAALGFLEPVSCGIGGDAFVMLWDTKQNKVVGFNGSGRSPSGMGIDYVKSRAKNNHIPSYGIPSISIPGAVDTWGQLHAKYGKLKFSECLEPAIALCENGAPVPQLIAYYLERNVARFLSPNSAVEETENLKKTYMPNGKTPREGEIFKNPNLANTYKKIAKEGARSFYEGDIARKIDKYFKRIGGFINYNDLKNHHGEFTNPISTNYRGLDVYGLAPNTQGLSTLQILNILENFDMKNMGFLSTSSIHTQVEAKRLAFEDRAKFFADPDFSKTPIEQLLSKSYSKELAAKIKQDAIIERIVPYEAPSKGDTTYFTVSDKNGMMVSWIQSNYRGMGSGLVPDDLGFMFQDRGELFSLKDGSPNIYAPNKRPFHTIIPGFATKNGAPFMSFGVMGGDMQPQGQAQIIVNMVDYGLNLQEAGDAPRWHHEGSSEPTGEIAEGIGILKLENNMPKATKEGLEKIGWKFGLSDGGFGGYQAIQKNEKIYGAASEMRKDGLALAY